MEALLYDKLIDKRTRCHLCAHRCLLEAGQLGPCRVRKNEDGVLKTSAYGQTLIENVDTIEKKPLFHFYPGSQTYSLVAHGCNFVCGYCANWEVSQMSNKAFQANAQISSPQMIVDAAKRQACQSIAFTYAEPTLFFEYAQAIAQKARQQGIGIVYKSNGFMTTELMEAFDPLPDAINIDLKTFSDVTYQRLGGRLQPVLDSLIAFKQKGVWLEVSTVLIPGFNDTDEEIGQMADFIANHLGLETPWHLTRFFPSFRMKDIPPTPVEILNRAHAIAKSFGLHNLYIDNLLQEGTQNTNCFSCGTLLIRRRGFCMLENYTHDSGCPTCGTQLPGRGWDL